MIIIATLIRISVMSITNNEINYCKIKLNIHTHIVQ